MEDCEGEEEGEEAAMVGQWSRSRRKTEMPKINCSDTMLIRIDSFRSNEEESPFIDCKQCI